MIGSVVVLTRTGVVCLLTIGSLSVTVVGISVTLTVVFRCSGVCTVTGFSFVCVVLIAVAFFVGSRVEVLFMAGFRTSMVVLLLVVVIFSAVVGTWLAIVFSVVVVVGLRVVVVSLVVVDSLVVGTATVVADMSKHIFLQPSLQHRNGGEEQSLCEMHSFVTKSGQPLGLENDGQNCTSTESLVGTVNARLKC